MFGLFEKIISIVLIIVGILLLALSGMAKWFGLLLAVIGGVMIFGNPIFGIIAIVVGALLFKFSHIAITVLRLIAIFIIAWGILSFTGMLPLELIKLV